MRHQSPKNRPTTLSWTHSGWSTSTLGPTCSRPSTAPRNRNWFPTDLGQLVFPSFMQHAGRPILIYQLTAECLSSISYMPCSAFHSGLYWGRCCTSSTVRGRTEPRGLELTTVAHVAGVQATGDYSERHQRMAESQPVDSPAQPSKTELCGWVRVGNISEIHILSTDGRVSDTGRDLAVVNVCTRCCSVLNAI